MMILLVTPLGSNNHIWPVLNNLFFIAPVALWMVYRFVRWGRTYLDLTQKVPLFPAKAMCAGIVIAFFVQAVGLGFGYVFLDGETGETRSFRVTGNHVLEGMLTTNMNGEVLEEITAYMTENMAEYGKKGLILYGNIPGLAYYLDMPPAIYTTWADLDSNPYDRLEEELSEISLGMGDDRPLVVITPELDAFLAGNEEAMDFWGTDRAACEQDKKLGVIGRFLSENAYEQVFANEAFIVYK